MLAARRNGRVWLGTTVAAGVLSALLSALPGPAGASYCFAPAEVVEVVLFPAGSATVGRSDRAQLAEAAERARDASLVCVIGQADRQGDPHHNLRLGLRRAEAVAAILREHSVPEHVIEIQSRGETPGGKARAAVERRVEVTVPGATPVSR